MTYNDLPLDCFILAQSSSYWFLITLILAMLLGFYLTSRQVRGTTYTAPLCWAMLAVVALLGCELLFLAIDEIEVHQKNAFRFAAATMTFCPMMAVLGAKRPQNRGWQFIVFSLWIILLLPCGHALLFRAGQALEIHTLQSWFLLILIGVGLVNYLATRFAVAAILYAAAQSILLAGYLPLFSLNLGAEAHYYALCSFAMAMVAAHLVRFRKRKCLMNLNRLWLDFRDMYGVIWAIRIMQRVNANSDLQDLPVVLTWSGFELKEEYRQQTDPAKIIEDSLINESHQILIEKNLRTLLRRFVSPQWIDQRLNQD